MNKGKLGGGGVGLELKLKVWEGIAEALQEQILSFSEDGSDAAEYYQRRHAVLYIITYFWAPVFLLSTQ